MKKQLLELLKDEIEFLELNPSDENLLNNENYLLKRFIIATIENGSIYEKIAIASLNHEIKDIINI